MDAPIACSFLCFGHPLVQVRDFSRQYSQMYFSRLQAQRAAITARANVQWAGLPERRVVDLGDDQVGVRHS